MIYTVTTQRPALYAGHRCVGYYEDLKDAEECVINNDCDISEEGYYRYAIIEEIEPGLYTFPRKEFWYRWDGRDKKYHPCEKPKQFKNTAGWGMG